MCRVQRALGRPAGPGSRESARLIGGLRGEDWQASTLIVCCLSPVSEGSSSTRPYPSSSSKAWTYLPPSYVVGTGSPVTGASGWWGWTAATSKVRRRHLEAAGKPSCGRAAADNLGESPARCSSSSQLPPQAPRTRADPTP